MKNIQKTLILLLCVAFCALIFACASSGGGKAPAVGIGPGVLATGEWNAYNDASDGGDSLSELVIAKEEIDGETVTTYAVKGNVTTKFQYGFAGWGIDPDEETLERFKAATAFSFKILGDGKRYSLKFKLSTVKDFAYHEYTFNTEEGVVSNIEVPMKFFMQPSWTSSPVSMRPQNVIGVEFQTHESWRPGTFQIKMWDFKVHN